MPNPQLRTVNTDIFRNAAALTITQKKWGNSRKVPIERGALAMENNGIITREPLPDSPATEVSEEKERKKKLKKRLRLSTRLVDSPEYDAIGEFQTATRKAVLNFCVPSFFKKGIYLVKADKVAEIDKLVEDANENLAKNLVPKFLEAYPKRKLEARAVLEPEGMYRETDFPDEGQLLEAFGVEHYWVAFGTPDNLPEGLREKAAAKLDAKFAEVEQEIIYAAREGFQTLVAHLVERLTPGEDGKKKTFQKGTVENLSTFLKTFSNRNLLNDAELEKLVTQARDAIAYVTPEGLRDSDQLRQAVSSQFQQLKEAADKLIVDRPGRKFALSNEEDDEPSDKAAAAA